MHAGSRVFLVTLLVAAGVWLAGCRGGVPTETAALAREVDRSLASGDRPIHPGVFRLLDPQMGGGLFVQRFDVSSLVEPEHQENVRTVPAEDGGGPWVIFSDNGGEYGYRRLGSLADGTHVLRLMYDDEHESGESLLLLRVEPRRMQAQPRWRVFLEPAGSHRLTGEEAFISIGPDAVAIGPARHGEQPILIRPDEK